MMNEHKTKKAEALLKKISDNLEEIVWLFDDDEIEEAKHLMDTNNQYKYEMVKYGLLDMVDTSRELNIFSNKELKNIAFACIALLDSRSNFKFKQNNTYSLFTDEGEWLHGDEYE